MTRLFPLVLAVWAFVSGPVSAQSPVVVELFTSQGCSSCPPADKLFHEIAGREDVIALSLHVDYWDYIGWKDAFADPAHGDRQRGYARVAGRRSVYTPQMIVNGRTDIVGTKPMKLADAITRHAASQQFVPVSLERSAGQVQVRAEPSGIEGPFVVHLLRYTPLREAKIKRGENAGRTIQYANVVEGWTVLGEWAGHTPLEMSADVRGEKPVVVLVQSARDGAIFGAARVK